MQKKSRLLTVLIILIAYTTVCRNAGCNNSHELKQKKKKDFPQRENRKVCGGGFEGLGTGCLEPWY